MSHETKVKEWVNAPSLPRWEMMRSPLPLYTIMETLRAVAFVASSSRNTMGLANQVLAFMTG